MITVLFTVCYRYITALTDSEEEESDDERKPLQEPVDELMALLQKADRLHSCNGAEKAQGLNALLERKDEVCKLPCESWMSGFMFLGEGEMLLFSKGALNCHK